MSLPEPTNSKSSSLDGWLRQSGRSLPEVFGSVSVPKGASFWKKCLAFAGPGFLVAVGYMDPGNWATDLAGGSRYGYSLLSVILLSNLIAILLQHLCVKLGVVTGRDLAQACRDAYSKPVSWILWILCWFSICNRGRIGPFCNWYRNLGKYCISIYYLWRNWIKAYIWKC